MSTCSRDLMDYNLVKKCSKCENIFLKNKFQKQNLLKMDIKIIVKHVVEIIVKITI